MREITAADLGQRPAMIIAHPDDESLWAGGLLARFKDLNWSVYCCSTPRRDPQRKLDFFDACEVLATGPRFCNTTVEGEPGEDIPDLDRYLGFLARHYYDCVVTHGPAGEYGHNQHVQVHNAVMNIYPGRVLGFGWTKRQGAAGPLRAHLTFEEGRTKRMALECYKEGKCEALRKLYYGQLSVPESVETFAVYRAEKW